MAADLSSKKSNFISRVVDGVSALLDATDAIIAERMQWDALGMSPASGSPYELTQDDFAGSNAHLTPQELADAFNSLDALKALLLQGHLTNLNKLRR